MSRHRNIRNLDLDSELADDDGYDSDPYANITEQEAADLDDALYATREVLGDERTSGFTDREIKDILWDKYFDVEGSLTELFEEKGRREARDKKKAEKEAAKKAASAASSKPGSGASTPNPAAAKAKVAKAQGGLDLRKAAVAGAGASSSSSSSEPLTQLQRDVEGMGLTAPASDDRAGGSSLGSGSVRSSAPGTPKVGMAHDKVVEEYKRKEEEDGRKTLSIVVVGHVDAGKSTLMGRILHELGVLSDREHTSNERASAKLGKGSFAYAWALDSSEEERERGVTIDVAQDNFVTPHRRFTLLDAPGHRDFIPNMISGAAQADAAILVVDAAKGAFEAGFGPNGQTREHAVLVRSLGVQQLVVVVNKLDAVGYDQGRFDDIVAALKPFFAHTGYDASKVSFVPCGGSVGENLSKRDANGALAAWYEGPTLVDVLDKLDPPARQLDAPLRMPITNVFKGQTALASGVGVSGRIVSGILTVGDRLRVVPGDECGIVRAIENEGESVPWAVAGAGVTAYLAGIDVIFVNIGSVLCPPPAPVPLCTTLTLQVLVFEPSLPLLAGTSLELFHHSSNLPATLVELQATLDVKSGAVLKKKPRVLSRNSTARVVVVVQSPIAVEPFSVNRDMGRILLRRAGETVAAGVVLECS